MGSSITSGITEDGSFITFERVTAGWGILGQTYVKYINVNYSALQNLEEVAQNADGLINTTNLYGITGNQNVSTIEEKIKALGFTLIAQDGDIDMPSENAAFMAITRNKMYELETTIKKTGFSGNDSETNRRPYLYKDETTQKYLIEWYLPSSSEAANLKETGNMAQGISPLNGTYWSSTAGDDANAWAHSYTFYTNAFSAIKEDIPRMTELKVRAVRKKP